MADELDNMGSEMTAAIGNGLALAVKNLLSFKSFLFVFDAACGVVGGWIDSLCYRDAGERGLRAAFGSTLQAIALGIQFALFHALFGGGWFAPIILLWAATMRYADWLSAMDRRKREKVDGYTFSYFMGWPRFLDPTDARSYWRQAGAVVLVGVLLFFLDGTGGALLVVAGFSLLGRLWTLRARWREEAMDSLDSEWEAEQRAKAKVQAGGADLQGQDAAVAQTVSTADFIRQFSTR